MIKAPAASSSPSLGETNVIDLMQVLRRSLAGEKGTQRRPPKRAAKSARTAAKKTPARKKS